MVRDEDVSGSVLDTHDSWTTSCSTLFGLRGQDVPCRLVPVPVGSLSTHVAFHAGPGVGREPVMEGS